LTKLVPKTLDVLRSSRPGAVYDHSEGNLHPLDKLPWSSILFSGIEIVLFVLHVAAPTRISSTELLWGQLIALPASLLLIKEDLLPQLRRNDTIGDRVRFVMAQNRVLPVLTAERKTAAHDAATLKADVALVVGAGVTPLQLMSHELPTGSAGAVARLHLEAYFTKAFSAMLASQLQALYALRAQTLTYADAKKYFNLAGISEDVLPFGEWIEYLSRFVFIQSAAGATMQDLLSIQELGSLFLAWRDARDSDVTLRSLGRG
jgi:hypothetical protein